MKVWTMSLLQMSFSGAVMILAIICIRCLTKNRIPKATFLVLWYAALLRLLLPFSLEASFSVYFILGQCASYADHVYTVGTIKGGAVSAKAMTEMVSTNVSAPSSFSWWWLIWCVGALACVVFFGVAYFRCFREFKMSLPVDNEYSQKWLIEHPLRRAISIRYSDRITAPLIFGILKPVILLPKNIDWENTTVLQYVLEHELVHIQHFDAVTKLLFTLAVCIHWFDPLVWVMYILVNRDIELSCDDKVVRRFGLKTRSDYARVLIRMEEAKSDFVPLCSNFSKNAIEERIVAIMKMKKTTIIPSILACIIVLCTIGAFATSAQGNTNKGSQMVEEAENNDACMSENELMDEYKKYGVTSLDGDLYYEGQLIRVFLDGYEREGENGKNNIIARYTSFNEKGTIDVHTVRNDITEADGSTTLFSEIIDIVPYEQNEFDERDLSLFAESEVNAFEEGEKNSEFASNFPLKFKEYGITYQDFGDGQGNICWNGEFVEQLWDEAPDGSVSVSVSTTKNGVIVKSVYDEDGHLTGIEYAEESSSQVQ